MTLNLNNKKGVTLFELLAVLVIIGILTGVAVTLFSGFIERTQIKADLANVEALNQATYYYVTLNDISNPYFEPTDTDEQRMQLLIDQGYINKIVVAKAKDASIYWSVDDAVWLYSLNVVAQDTTEQYIFEDFDTSEFVQSGTWVENTTNLYSTYGLLFIENPRSEYRIDVSAKLNSGTSGGFGIFFETTLAPDNKDTGFALQFDRGYVSGTVLIRPRTNGAEGSPISTHKFDYTNSFIPNKNTPDGTLWWASTHEITLEVTIDPNTPFTKILSVWIDDQLLFDNFSFQSSISSSNNFTGLRTWSSGVEFYHVYIEDSI